MDTTDLLKEDVIRIKLTLGGRAISVTCSKMKAIYLLVFFVAALISFGGCKNKAAKNSVSYPAEEFYNDSLPDELKKMAYIEFVSQNNPKERITMSLQEPVRINKRYPPLLKF